MSEKQEKIGFPGELKLFEIARQVHQHRESRQWRRLTAQYTLAERRGPGAVLQQAVDFFFFKAPFGPDHDRQRCLLYTSPSPRDS